MDYKNLAAERLRDTGLGMDQMDDLHAALAEERRHVIEQINDAVTRLTEETLSPPTLAEFRAILDAVEADR